MVVKVFFLSATTHVESTITYVINHNSLFWVHNQHVLSTTSLRKTTQKKQLKIQKSPLCETKNYYQEVTTSLRPLKLVKSHVASKKRAK